MMKYIWGAGWFLAAVSGTVLTVSLFSLGEPWFATTVGLDTLMIAHLLDRLERRARDRVPAPLRSCETCAWVREWDKFGLGEKFAKCAHPKALAGNATYARLSRKYDFLCGSKGRWWEGSKPAAAATTAASTGARNGISGNSAAPNAGSAAQGGSGAGTGSGAGGAGAGAVTVGAGVSHVPGAGLTYRGKPISHGAAVLLGVTGSVYDQVPDRPKRPTETVFGEVRAYRCWRLTQGYLCSASAGTPWAPNAPMRADLKQEDWLANDLGIHAFKSPHLALEYLMANIAFEAAYGEVELWGEIVEHELGYRAEFARVSRIDGVVRAPPEALAKVRELYGVAG